MNVTIRPLQEKDAYVSVKWRNIPDIWKYTEYKWTHEITIDDELTWIRKVMVDPTSKRFAILADDKYVGNIYLTNIKDDVGEYSIFIGDKDYWGKGIARKATEEIIAFAKNTLHLRGIVLRVDKNNAPALRLYTSFGFKETGEEGVFIWMSLNLSTTQT